METWTVKKLEPGDHIRVDRGAYFHHGIYIGGGEVVHFAGPDGDAIDHPEDVSVRRSSMEDFLGGKDCFCEARDYSSDKRRRRAPGEIVDYALKCLGRGGYDILTNNCEHFANECVYGEAYSEYVDSVREHVRTLLGKKNN